MKPEVFIEIWVRGEMLCRWSADDFGLEMPDTYDDFEGRTKVREQFIDRFMEVFKLRMEHMLQAIGRYRLYLVFESSMRTEQDI